MNIALRRFLHNHGNIATEGSPKPGLYPTLFSNDFKGSLLCTVLQAALYTPGTSRLQTPVDTNEPPGLTTMK